jgi:G2/mitotic-specific cyclin 1/2
MIWITQMSRIAAARRGVASSTSETHIEGKPKRAPLARISNNTRLRAPVPDRASKPTVREPAITIEPPAPVTFHHHEVPIGDPEDPQDVAEFEHIIYRSLRGKEGSLPRLRFTQPDITLRDRSLLVDALDRFHYKLGLTTNALYRFIGILDRFLAAAPIPKQKLRVVGCAALLIASKIEDVFPAQSNDLIQLSEHSFTQSELFSTEIQVINAIQFETTFATPLFFLTQFMRIHDQTKESLLLGRYILEICHTHEAFFGVPPSLLAALATMVARMMTGDEKWSEELASYTMYSEVELAPHAATVRAMLLETDRPESRFMKRKYGSEPFHAVAHIAVPADWH